jgi:hypothetical protein
LRPTTRIRPFTAWGIAAVTALWLAPAAGFAQTPAPKPPPPPEATPVPPPPLEPEALARLKAMSDLLKGASSFTFKASTDREQPSTAGPMLDFFSVSQIAITRPNQFRVDSKGDLHDASIWYDGKTLTIYSLKSSFYGEAAAPATVDETVMMLIDRLQTPLPVGGFLLKDPYAKMMDGVKTAFDAGDAVIDGVACRHLAFSEEDADWQVWIENGAKPLPRRIAVTYKNTPGAPRVVTTLSDWNLAPKIPASDYTFKAPAGATKVDWKTVEK